MTHHEHTSRIPTRERPHPRPAIPASALSDPPPNPAGGKTLIVDASEPLGLSTAQRRASRCRTEDQVFVRPGRYEDKVFVTDRPILLIGAGREHVEIFSRRGGPLYLQRVTEGPISGVTFRYVGSNQIRP